MMNREIVTCEDPDDLARRAADWLVTQLGGEGSAPQSVCLSGGSTPRRLYQRLSRDPWRRALAWDRLHWFWGDERVVPPDDPRSNFAMAHEALLDHVPAPTENIHAIPTIPDDPMACASAYEAVLQRFHGSERLDDRPLFDVTLLGLGPDGHTASLFPGSPALKERQHWTAATEPGLEPYVPRVTLTLPALASSRAVVFLVSGADKAAILKRVMAGEDLPSAAVTREAPTIWFVDRSALGA
jgi:6-phosphogluconolactonase